MRFRRREPEAPRDPESPGWDAIQAALDGLYPEQEHRHIGYTPGLAFGSGLQGCSAYRAEDHWHYVTFGLTELWAKEEGSDPAASGWGYELTMRVTGPADEAPPWPFGLLEPIARHTRTNAHPFEVGDRLEPGGPITGSTDTRLVALAFTHDRSLAPIETTNGRVEFRQAVGITAEELAEMRATSTDAVLARLAADNPLLVTDPAR